MTHINNMPTTVRAWIVARDIDGDLWYWGSWDSENDARTAAQDIDGVLIARDMVEA